MNESDRENLIKNKDEAIAELAHVAENLLARLVEIDDTPGMSEHGMIKTAIENKIAYYKAQGGQHA